MYYYRIVKTGWGMVAYVVRNDKLVKLFTPPALITPPMTSTEEKKQIAIQLSAIDDFARKSGVELLANPKLLESLADELNGYFCGRTRRFKVQYDLSRLTPFTRHILTAVAKIPYGKTISYKALAEKVGRPTAFRAVARALASNPIPIIIPCHRVVYCNGSIGGYTAPAGPAMKIKLLELESQAQV